jgi:Xaa-Pro aminopeptidase
MSVDKHTPHRLVPPEEIYNRVSKLQGALCEMSIDGALILDRVNMYYYSGTMQQGVVCVPAEGEPVFLIRRSVERGQRETPLKRIVPLKGFSELGSVLEGHGMQTESLGLDETSLPVSLYRRLKDALPGAIFHNISFQLAMIRAVKSDYEVSLIREAGKRHAAVYEAIPRMVREGMTEWELGAAIHQKMVEQGYCGLTRLSAFGGEMFMGVISFGESGNYPTDSVGPDGLVGLSPAFPLVGGNKRLQRGEPIFVDTGFGYEGYFVDKTRVFCLGPPCRDVVEAHQTCLEIQEATRRRLQPGAIPAEIFDQVYREEVSPRGFEKHFMGFGTNQVAFLGHGIGLVIDEAPAIAKKVYTPLQKNMVIALEPKKGLEGVGLVGIENTFLVTDQGGEKLTPGSDELSVIS